MADKKISELPLLNSVSGSSIIVPLVHDGTTNKINLSQIAQYSSQWSAKTGSANTFTGNQTIVGNLVVSGDLTAERYYIETISSSIIYESGSTTFGNSGDDTHTFTGSIILNGATIGAAELNSFTASQLAVNLGISSVTGSINTQSSSQDLVNVGISSVTGAINTTTASFDSVFLGISSTTGSINTTTASFDSVFLGISSVTGSINTTTASFDSVFLGISSTTGSINTTTSSFDSEFGKIGSTTASLHFTTSSLNAFTGSIIGQNNTISTFTSSVNFATQSLNTQTGSQDLVNRGISSVTGSINTTTSSFDSVFLGISSVTGSLIGITNTLMAFTAALDNTYATDAQLYQLYQATASIHSTTSSLNIQTGSQDLVNRGISSVTGSINTTTSSFDSVFLRISSTTGSINLTTSSLIGITNGLMAFTAALDSTYATDAQLYQLYQATASIHSATASLNTQTGSQDLVNRGISSVTGSINTTTSSFDSVFLRISSTTGSINTTTSSFNSVFLGISSVTGAINTQSSSQDLVNLGISSVTGSLIGITNGLMAFTAALDTTYATDAQLYQLYQATASIHFATQSLNTQTGSQDSVNLGISNVTGSFRAEIGGIEAYTSSLKSALTISGTDVTFTGKITAQEFTTVYTTSSVLYQSGSTKFGNTFDDKHEFTGSVKISGSFEVQGTDTGASVGDLLVDSINKYVYVGRQSVTSGDNTTLVLRDRTGTARATLPAGGSYDTIFTTNASNFKVTNYSGTDLLNVSNIGNVTASGTFTIGGQTQIGTATTDTSLGSNTKLKVVGDGSVNAGASQGSLFVAAGNQGGDTGLPINMGTAGATALLLASINTSTGTATNSATYIVRFYFDGNNAPTTTYLGGSSDFVTFGVTPSNTLAVSGSSSGNKSYAWFINKFGA